MELLINEIQQGDDIVIPKEYQMKDMSQSYAYYNSLLAIIRQSLP